MAQQSYLGPSALQHSHPAGRGGVGHAQPSARNLPHPSHGYPTKHHSGGQKSGGPTFGDPHYPSGQQQINLGDLSSGSLDDLVPRVSALGFPKSCSFVLGLLERYFISQLDSAKDTSTNLQLTRENIIGLIDAFVVNPAGNLEGVEEGKMERLLNPLEQIQLLLTIHTRLEEQEYVQLRYCMFDAIFSEASAEEGKDQEDCVSTKSEILGKLVSLSVTLESRAVLACTARWMEEHPLSGLSLARTIFNEFCVLLPNALEPLLGLASHSPRFAQQMAVAFATLHPFHVVGALLPVVDTSHLHPPIGMLQLVLQWVESNSELFCVTQHADLVPSRLPLLHSPSLNPPAPPRSLVTGVIQWCILAPMVNDKELYSGTNSPGSSSTEMTKTGSKSAGTTNSGGSSKSTGSIKTDSNSAMPTNTLSVFTERNFQCLVSRLHAEVLSALLSLSQSQALSVSRSGSSLVSTMSSDDVAMVVAALIAFGAGGRGEGKEDGYESDPKGGDDSGSRNGGMEESVERFAQFLQISMSTKILQLKPEDMNSIASALPRNRLLDLVISHSK